MLVKGANTKNVEEPPMDSPVTKKSSPSRTLAWVTLGVLLGVGVATYALKRSRGEEASLGDTLDDLFRVCEADCNALENRLSKLAS
ncbi:MAG: hypothetical protein IT206_03740 [Fimbriimonadaceae bacterium]|nr:hypothetical protein [Fimbriimonadaceae bacterium]